MLHPGAIWLECLKGIPRSSGSALLSINTVTVPRRRAVASSVSAAFGLREPEPKLVLCLEGKLGN